MAMAWRNGWRRRSVDVSVADAEPRRDGGAGSRFGGSGFGLAVATVALTVVATNVAVGVFLWLAIDARLTNLEADVRESRVGMNDINARLTELSTRVARLEGKPGVTPPPTPEGMERRSPAPERGGKSERLRAAARSEAPRSARS